MAAPRWLVGYPGRPLTALVLAIAAGGVWASTAYTFGWFELVGVWVGMPVVLLWAARTVLGTIDAVRAGGRPPWRVVVTLVLFAGAVVLALSGLPLHLRFDASQAALPRAADRALAGEAVGAGRIGLYDVDAVRLVDDTVLFELGDCMFDTCGVAFAADGRPDVEGELYYDRLDGRWFTYVLSW